LEIENRIQRLLGSFADKEIDAILVSQPDNLYYLSGCEGMEGYLLVTPQKAVVITDFRYIEQAERQSPHCEIFQIKGKMAEWFPVLFSSFDIRNLGFEANHLTYASYEHIAGILRDNHMSMRLVPVNGLIESQRMFKDQDEIRLVIEAAKITGAALEYVEKILQPGFTEKALAWEIERFMRDHGSQQVPFDLIVAAGPNSALPHARPSDRVIQKGEPVVVDIGSRSGYYGSDMTRTFCIGQPDETFKKVYKTVLDAQSAAIDMIRAGMNGTEADATARDIIARAGYGDFFGHSLGHGIGLVTHENPRVGPNSTDILAEHMVFTIEPGIYLSGWGGVRIEDDVVIDNGKIRVISFAKK
jgi:Xaa-Pro aminopeptidase